MMAKQIAWRGARLGALLIVMALAVGCKPSKDWPAYRADFGRSGEQRWKSDLTDISKVSGLSVQWTFTAPGGMAFRASPVVFKGRVYIGNGNGRFYALNAATGALDWEYPAAGDPALTSMFTCNPSSTGIASSAAIAKIGGRHAVIFGAPDRSIGAGLGSGRLFALDSETGAEIWKSPEVARLTGTTSASETEIHEQIGYSAPLVYRGRVYIGLANHCDNPIQNGRIVAVDLATGAIDAGFSFSATSTRGGGIWSSVGADGGGGIYATTGNVRCWNGGCQTEPPVNHSLALLRADRASGALVWKLQPVPFALDNDPDWATGPTVMRRGTCGPLVVSTMKDGWTYAVEAGDGTAGPPTVRWQFPPTGFPFAPGDGTVHNDTRYLRPGAAWGNVFIGEMGGVNVPVTTATGFGKLHALNACAPEANRIRWIVDVPGAVGSYGMGPPTVSKGIVFVGTASGNLVVIADPSRAPAVGMRCNNPAIPNAACPAGNLVPQPAILADIPLGAGGMRTEPALSRGRVFVSTQLGKVVMLDI